MTKALSWLVMSMTVDSVNESGESAAVLAWLTDHIGRARDRCVHVMVMPYLGVIAFKILVHDHNGAFIVQDDGNMMTRWIVTGIKSRPMKNWCE